MNDKFDQFVKEQIESSEANGGQLDLATEKASWLEKLNQLYALVSESVAKYIENGSITLQFHPVELTEEWLGTYTAQQATIIVGRQVVQLQPLGTFLIGSNGRVDMLGPRGSVRLTIVPASATKPQFRTFLGASRDTSEGWVWKIATPPPNISYIDLTPASFRDALMSVVNG